MGSRPVVVPPGQAQRKPERVLHRGSRPVVVPPGRAQRKPGACACSRSRPVVVPPGQAQRKPERVLAVALVAGQLWSRRGKPSGNRSVCSSR